MSGIIWKVKDSTIAGLGISLEDAARLFAYEVYGSDLADFESDQVRARFTVVGVPHVFVAEPTTILGRRWVAVSVEEGA